MAVMEDGDFEILGVLLKGSPDYPIYVQGFDPGKTDHREQDMANPLDDTIEMGRDYVIPPTWEFVLGMGDFTPGPAIKALGEVMKVWRVPQRTPGAYVALKYMVDGRVRQVFGRPRPFTFDPALMVNVGYVKAVAAFHLKDALHYSVNAQTLDMSMVNQPLGGGFQVPFTVPILTDPGSTRAGFVTNNGSAPAPFTLRVNGPNVNPVVSASGWELALDHAIPEGDWVEIDTRARTVRGKNGANLSGRLKRSSGLLSARLKPGRSEVLFTGTDPTGISNIKLTWFDAYYEH